MASSRVPIIYLFAVLLSLIMTVRASDDLESSPSRHSEETPAESFTAPALSQGSVPPERPVPGPPAAQPLVQHYAAEELGDWRKEGKVGAPRAVLARLLCNSDIEKVNSYLRGATPWSESGSTWAMHKGDYDFTEVTLTTIFYLFGNDPDRLYPETASHLLNVLLVEEGGLPRTNVPESLGMVGETENHVLMTESSRYLKNQWLFNDGSDNPAHHNLRNGLKDWLLAYLDRLRSEGFREFNSVPYQGYAIQALLNIEAFAEPPDLAHTAREILDGLAWRYALGSLDYRQCVPFRRGSDHARDTSLALSPLNSVMRIWAGINDSAVIPYKHNHHAFIAAVMPYRPPRRTLDHANRKEVPYYAQIGHGLAGSPEIFSAGPGYLLSAGGAGRMSLEGEVVSRPTVLLLKDDADDIEHCISLPGGGQWWERNNTGVHARFACSNAPVRIPDSFVPVAQTGNWKAFAVDRPLGLIVATYSADDCGLLVLFEDEPHAAGDILNTIVSCNVDGAALRHTFTWPDGSVIDYDVEAPADTWVIREVDGRQQNRDYDRWPLLTELPNEAAFQKSNTFCPFSTK